MEPSDEEEDTEIAPAASEQQQVTAEGTETNTPAASELAAKVEGKLRQLEDCLERASQQLVAYGPRRDMGDFKQRCLAFTEMELSSVIASFKLIPQPLQLQDELDFDVEGWLHVVDSHSSRMTKSSARIIDDLIAPPSHMLLRSAAMWCFCRRVLTRSLQAFMVFVYFDASQSLTVSRSLLPATSNHVGLAPRESKAAGIPLVAINRPMKKLLRWLVSHEETNRGLRVMWIVGPAGVAKTALAMEIHNRLKCQTSGTPYSFHCNIMVRAPQTTHSHELLLQDILSKISDPATPAPSVDESQTNRMEFLVRCVLKRLKDKRYFICIDDMWEASGWEKIKGAFPDNNLGSRVLITTGDQSTTWSDCSHSDVLVHKMEPLNHVDTERLLWKQFAQIATSAQVDVDDRLMVPNNLWVQLLYMCMFPYGYLFDKDRLISKWFYEGFGCFRYDLQSFSRYPWQRNKFAAHFYFPLLVNNDVITWVAANRKMNPDETEAGHWHVNYLYHQFAVFKSAETGFAFTTATLKLAAAPKIKPRKLALHHPDPQLSSLLEALDLSWTRSLAVSGAVCQIPLDKFVGVVVLDLEGWENLTDEVLLQMCTSNMFFLQYLSIRNTRVSKLPLEIKKLCSLWMLDVSYTQISELPLEVYQLAHLRELDLRGTRIRKLPKQIVGLSLQVLLLGVEGMINSTETATRVPHDIQHLWYLETLATVDLSEEPASLITALGNLKYLQVLAITWSFHQCTDKAYSDALISSIREWKRLEYLTIHCGLGCSMEFLDSLSYPPEYLEKFKVTAGRFANVPKWISKLYHLSFVEITVCKQGREDLDILGGLPKLRCLILGLDFIPTKAVVIESEKFPELETFSVDCPMPRLIFQTGAMQKLTYLQLMFCATPASPNSVPSDIGNLQSLTEVALCYNVRCASSPSVRATVEAVRAQVANHNQIDLFINGIQDCDFQAACEGTENWTGAQSGTGAETKDDVQAVDEKLENAATQIQSTSEIEELRSDALFQE